MCNYKVEKDFEAAGAKIIFNIVGAHIYTTVAGALQTYTTLVTENTTLVTEKSLFLEQLSSAWSMFLVYICAPTGWKIIFAPAASKSFSTL